MFDKISPQTDEFELLKEFCFKIGEGRIEHHVEEFHYTILYHPTVTEALLIVHWDAMEKRIYIREPIEGGVDSMDQWPLVHSFPLEGRSIFPWKVRTINEEEVEYIYQKESPIGATISENIPREQYLRLEMMFDEKNPVPWFEE